MKNNQDLKNNEELEYREEIDEYELQDEDMDYNEDMSETNRTKRSGHHNKKKIIMGVIVALVAIGLISGFLLYLNGNKQDEERQKLVSEIHKNNLTKENADYLQNKKYVNQDQLNQLNSIDQKASDANQTLDQIKNLLKDQSSILNPINKKLGDNDSNFTKSLNYFLGLLPGLGSAVSNVINVDEIKNIVSQKFDLQKIVNENTPIIKKKDEALSMISKVAYDKKALLKGKFSSIAGTYVNSEGKQMVVNKQGINDKNNSCKASKPKLNKLGYYVWSIKCADGSTSNGFFFPIGIPVTLELGGGKTKLISTDIKKNRVMFGKKLSNKAQDYYARK